MTWWKAQLDRLRRRIEPLRVRIDLLISGRAPEDPFYLSNRTWQQKLKTASLVGAPVVLLIALVTIGATDLFRLHKVDPYARPPAEAQPAPQKRLPDPVLTPEDLEVVDIRIAKDANAPAVTGIVRNNTNLKVDSAQVTYYLADTEGSLVATDTTDVANVGPHGSVAFRAPLKIANAEYVIVRDVRLN